MSKKLFTVFLGALLVLGLAGQSAAMLSDNYLYRVVWSDSDTHEVITNLGLLGTDIARTNGVITALNQTVGTGAGAFDLSQFGGSSVSDWSNLHVAYFAKSGTFGAPNQPGQAWLSGGPTTLANQGGTFKDKFNLIGATPAVGQSVQILKSVGYYFNMDNDGLLLGAFGGLLSSPNGEASLAALASVGDYVQQTLYYFGTAGANINFRPGVTASDSSVTLWTQLYLEDGVLKGQTIINPVPIPPAVLLLGSGLLGLIGLRRRAAHNAAAV